MTFASSLSQTKQHFRPQLLENVDDVIAFRSLSFQQLKAVARLQLRDIASCMTQKGLIIYPSEAALDIIVQRSTWLGDRIVCLSYSMIFLIGTIERKRNNNSIRKKNKQLAKLNKQASDALWRGERIHSLFSISIDRSPLCMLRDLMSTIPHYSLHFTVNLDFLLLLTLH